MKCPNKGTTEGIPGSKYLCPECSKRLILLAVGDHAFIPAHDRLEHAFTLAFRAYNARADKHGELP